MTDIIAEQDFNALSDSDSVTSDSLPSGSTLTNAGSQNIGGPGLGFITTWVDTRGEGTGPAVGGESGDFIGVNSFSGSNAPDVAADGTPVASGTEHNFQFNDGDGQLVLTFDAADLAGFENRALTFDYWIADTGFESDDSFVVEVFTDSGSATVLELGEAALEAQGTCDAGNADEWQSVTFDLEPLLGETEDTALLVIAVDTNSGSENIFVDTVAFTGDAVAPQTPLISEFEPNPDGLDPDFQLVELSGTPGDAFDGFLSFIEADNDSEEIQNVNAVSGTFDDNGLLVVAVPDPENPGFTMVLSSELNDDLSETDDVDVDGDGAVDDAAGLFGTVFDAIGVPDTEGDRVFGASLGGVDLTVRVDPELLFRAGSRGEIFTVQDTLTPSAEALDEDGNAVALSEFSFLPTPDSFGTVNPVLDDDAAPAGALAIDDVTVAEGGDAVFTVTLTTRNGDVDPFFATVATADDTATAGSDFVANTTVLAFNGTDGETQTFTVSTIDDDAGEADETFAAIIQSTTSDQVTILDDTGTGTILDNDEAVVIGQFVESFEEAPGTTYLLSSDFDEGFDFFDRFPAPDDSNAARDDFQTGFDGAFAIFGQDHDGGEGAATRTITIPNIDIGALDLPSLTVSLGALDSAPNFLNYEAADGDGIRIFATVDGGARTLIAEFAPPAGGAGDLSLDTDGDGVGDGIIGLGTDLAAFGFALNQTGESLTIEIDLTSTGSFEPLVVDNVIIDEGAVVINEVIYRHTGSDDTEFVELFGTANQSLEGLSLIQVDLSGNIVFQQDFGADDALGANGFFLLGGPELESFGATPDILLEVGALETFGDNGAIDGESATFALIATDTLGATVTGTEATLDVVAFTDPSNVASTFPFDAPVVGPDGTFPPAGGSRVEDGVDTDSAADWQLRSFFLGDITPTSSTSGAAGGVATDATIPEIQGAGRSSDLAGTLVRTTGIVTAVDSNGFYLQDPAGDGDDATSDAIFVFTSSAPAVSVGDEAEVTGPVLEFGSGIGETQISLPTDVTVLSEGNALPAATVIGTGGRVQPTDTIENGIDFYESLEGMRVTVNAPVATSPTDGSEIYVLADLGAGSPSLSDRGTNNNGLADFNPEKILVTLDAGLLPGETLPSVAVGTGFDTITGVLNYSGSEYEVLPTAAVTVATASDLAPEVTTLTRGDDQLTLATYNVLNLDPGDGAARFDALGAQIADNLGSPDIIALQEIQDNSGATDDGTVSASQTLQLLADAIEAAGGPAYEVIDNTFITDNLSGGQPGGNIRTAFLYNPERVDLAPDSVRPVGDQEPGSPFNGARLPLAADFEFNGETVTVVNNHLSSKGGSVALFGDTQPTDTADAQEDPAINGSLDERREQAQGVNDFVDAILAEDADANVVVLGDLNEFEFISPVDTILTGEEISLAGGFELGEGGTPILTNLTDTLPENEQYTFIFEGTSQSLDHILVTDSLVDSAEIDIVHVNTEFVEETSDHDPIITRLDFSEDTDVFTLELLHATDQEPLNLSGSFSDITNLSAVMNALEAEDLGNDGQADNTVRLSSGDAFIPGLFFSASGPVFGSAGIADIQIQNELGFSAIAFGNHEFDFGTDTLAGLLDGSAPGSILGADFTGADFPYLSTNLDFSTDANLAPLETAGGQAPLPNTVTSSVVLDVNGESVGVVGATTPTLGTISSPGDVGISPSPFGANPTDAELDALAAEIQTEVDAVLDANPGLDKVILLAHMQQIAIEFDLATRLSGVDVIVAGGSNTRLFDENDRVREGDTDQGEYPQFFTDADGNPIAVVNTDGSYKYVGRLVIDFDENGNIVPESYDAEVSGAYATDDQGVSDLNAGGLIDPEVQQIVDAIEAQVIATEGNVFGTSDVFLNGNRSGDADDPADTDGVRTQETNLGNLTADANLAEAQKTDDTVMISLKNGGGIRASIGETVVPAGGTEAVRLPNGAVFDSGDTLIKPAGGISENDIKTTLAFNNGLVLVTLTAAEIVDLIEHGVSGLPGVSGRFAQISGIEFSFDPDLPAGSRVLSAEVVDDAGNPVTALVVDGDLVGDASQTFRVVTLGFLAAPRFDDDGNFTGGGDGYPFPNTNTDPDRGALGDPDVVARVDFVSLEQDGVQTGTATFADDGTEQDALAEFLAENFSDTPFSEADTDRGGDTRIQNTDFRADTVLEDGVFLTGNDDVNRMVGPDGGAVFDGLGARDFYVGGLDGDIFVLGDGDKDQVRALDIADIFDVSAWGVQSFEELRITDRGALLTIFDQKSGNAAYAFDPTDADPAADDLTADNFLFAAVENLVVEDTRDSSAERLLGRAGDDEIRAGDGFNNVSGFGGADLFVIADATRGTVLRDLDLGEGDRIDLAAWGVDGVEDPAITEDDRFVFVREAGTFENLVRIDRDATGLSADDIDADAFAGFGDPLLLG